MPNDERRQPRIFLSYAHKDAALFDEFKSHLGALNHLGYAEFFSDQQIKPGDRWEKTIQEKLASADIVVFLVSPDFMSSRYCTVSEMLVTLSRNQKVFPVLIRDCDFQALPLSDHQALPIDSDRNLKAVALWGNSKNLRDRAWTQIAKALRALLESEPARNDIDALIEQRESREIDVSIAQPDFDPWKESAPLFEQQFPGFGEFILDGPTDKYSVSTIVAAPSELMTSPRYRALFETALVDAYESALLYQQTPSELGAKMFIHACFDRVSRRGSLISTYGMVRAFFGGVHSSYHFVAINYDEAESRLIRLSDIFDRQCDNALAREILRSLRASSTVSSLTQQEIDSFPDILVSSLPCSFVWTPGKDDLLFRFLIEPYVVASFSAGWFTVDIPLNKVRHMLSSYFLRFLRENNLACGLFRSTDRDHNTSSSVEILPGDIEGIYVMYGEMSNIAGKASSIEASGVVEWPAGSFQGNSPNHQVAVRYTDAGLDISETGHEGQYGMGLGLSGTYTRVTPG